MRVILAIEDGSLKSRLALINEALRNINSQAILVDVKPDVFERSMELPKTNIIVLTDSIETIKVPIDRQLELLTRAIAEKVSEIPEKILEKRPKAFSRLEDRIRSYNSNKRRIRGR